VKIVHHVEQERSTISDSETSKSSAEEYFSSACYLTSHGKPHEAELAIKKALNIRDNYPIAWAILSAIYLSQGSETDAEQAGKKAIEQCKSLKMTWPKMRSIILSKGIIRGSSWKDPRRVVIQTNDQTEWSKLLLTLGEASSQEIKELDVKIDDVDKQDKGLEPLKYDPKEDKTKEPEKESKPSEKQGYQPPERHTYSPPRAKGFHSVEERFSETLESTVQETKKEEAEVWITSAQTYLKRGNLERAEEAFLKGLEADPDNGEAWLQMSSLLMGKHKYDEAIDALKNATEQIPKSAAAWYQLGYCYQKLNKWQASIQPLKQATLLDKLKPDFWMALAFSQFQMGQYQFAAKSLLRVLRMSPNHKRALFYLAQCMEKQGNMKHALSLYIKLLNIGGLKPSTYERMAGAFKRMNRPVEAREAMRRAALGRRSQVTD
jgi:tetratricopeptide (TPR) repeat protein